jgi:hypothetical protein
MSWTPRCLIKIQSDRGAHSQIKAAGYFASKDRAENLRGPSRSGWDGAGSAAGAIDWIVAKIKEMQ